MSFFSNQSAARQRKPVKSVLPDTPAPRQESVDAQVIYQELIDKRPALLEEKLKLHTRIIDEFNLLSLEKLPRVDLDLFVEQRRPLRGELMIELFLERHYLGRDQPRRARRLLVEEKVHRAALEKG